MLAKPHPSVPPQEWWLHYLHIASSAQLVQMNTVPLSSELPLCFGAICNEPGDAGAESARYSQPNFALL